MTLAFATFKCTGFQLFYWLLNCLYWQNDLLLNKLAEIFPTLSRDIDQISAFTSWPAYFSSGARCTGDCWGPAGSRFVLADTQCKTTASSGGIEIHTEPFSNTSESTCLDDNISRSTVNWNYSTKLWLWTEPEQQVSGEPSDRSVSIPTPPTSHLPAVRRD